MRQSDLPVSAQPTKRPVCNSMLGRSALVVVLLTCPGLLAADVPFHSGRQVEGTFDGAESVFAADIDGDGDLDVLGAAYLADDITWWENTAGDGTAWTEHTLDGDFDGACSVFAADIDGDGDVDVLGAAGGANDIAWWENTAGDGSAWAEHTVDGDFDGANSVFAGDVDGDGDKDILGAAYFADDITWWENTAGDGIAWAEHAIDSDFTGAWSVHAADVDRDGDTDVLGAAAAGISWWENTAGDGTTWTEHTVDGDSDYGDSVFAADVDGDGDTDILGAGYLAGIVWWENTAGDATAWTEHTVDGGLGGAGSVFAADVDSDGDTDVLGAKGWENSIAWWENTTADGTAWTEHTVAASFVEASSVFAADMDSDGDLDLLGAASDDDDIAWWENESLHRSALYAAAHAIDGAFGWSYSVRAADLDGDGDLDVLQAEAGFANELSWWENTTRNGAAWSKHTLDGAFDGARSVYAADLDGDGDLDVLGAAYSDGDIAWWENTSGDGSAWSKQMVNDSFYGANSVHAADIDGDGDLDVLGATPYSYEVAWWENTTGDGSTWTEHLVDGLVGWAWAVDAADVDGDGDTDVLGAADAGFIAWWENTAGDGSAWSRHIVRAGFSGARSVHAADIDGDGDVDVLGAAYDADEIAWWENTTGDGSAWSEQTIDSSFAEASSVFAADVDGDGDLDVLGTAHEADDISWWENVPGGSGFPIVWLDHRIDSYFNEANSVFAADIDADGDLDILGAAFNTGNNITWWENLGGQFVLATTDTAPATIVEGFSDDVLVIEAGHQGQEGDNDLELATLELLLEESPGDSLTTAEANNLVAELEVYLDDRPFSDCSSIFLPLVTSVETLALDAAGIQTVQFVDGSPDVRVEWWQKRRYCVEVRLTPDAATQTPNNLRVTHITESSSTAEDADHDTPLILEFSPNVASGTVVAQLSNRRLTVTKAGSGDGTVISTPAGIDCGSACQAWFDRGTSVALTATAASDSQFIGWSGDPDCSSGVLTMDAFKSCTATFDLLGPPVDLVLDDEIVNTVEVYEACRSITATNFDVVIPGGDATFRAGEYVVLGDGFSVEENCHFTAEIQVPSGCL